MGQLPGWVHTANERRAAKLKAIADGAPILHRPVADSFHTAPGWRQVEFSLSCIPDAEIPWDPRVVKAVWKFDPTFVPCVATWVFAPPGKDSERVIFKRFMLTRHEPNPRTAIVGVNITMPAMPCQGLNFKKPNVLEFPLMFPSNSDFPNEDLPGDYIPFDFPVVEWMKARFKASQRTPGEIAKYMIDTQRDEREARILAQQEEQEERQNDLVRFAEKKLSNLSEVEIKERLLGQ